MIKNKIKTINIKNLLFVCGILLVVCLMVLTPQLSMTTFLDGIRIWATKVLPSLLPFFILTKLLSYTNFVKYIGKSLTPTTTFLYGVGGVSGYIYVMSIISGYPLGAKLTSDFYKNKFISKRQAYAITSFTSTSGPLFILGSVAIGLFNDNKLGIILLITHFLGALINGLFYRSKSKDIPIFSTNHLNTNFLNDSMASSINSIMIIRGFIALFYMILNICIAYNIFSPITNILSTMQIDKNLSISVISGLIEVTSGCILLSQMSLPFLLKSAIISFLIAFGGFSIHAQAYTFLKDFNMPYSLFILQKFTQALITCTLTTLFVIIF